MNTRAVAAFAIGTVAGLITAASAEAQLCETESSIGIMAAEVGESVMPGISGQLRLANVTVAAEHMRVPRQQTYRLDGMVMYGRIIGRRSRACAKVASALVRNDEQVDQVTARQTSGYGLGLTLSTRPSRSEHAPFSLGASVELWHEKHSVTESGEERRTSKRAFITSFFGSYRWKSFAPYVRFQHGGSTAITHSLTQLGVKLIL